VLCNERTITILAFLEVARHQTGAFGDSAEHCGDYLFTIMKRPCIRALKIRMTHFVDASPYFPSQRSNHAATGRGRPC
jgi:hypothetical protein